MAQIKQTLTVLNKIWIFLLLHLLHTLRRTSRDFKPLLFKVFTSKMCSTGERIYSHMAILKVPPQY